MSERINNFGLEAAAAMVAHRLIKLDSNGKAAYMTATSTDVPLGVLDRDVALGEVAGGPCLNRGGTIEMMASGAITLAADVYAAADGKVQALPGDAGTYRKIGQAQKAASGDGSVIPVYPYDYITETTVT